MVCCINKGLNDFSFPPNSNIVKKVWGYFIEHYRADDLSVCFKTLVIDVGHQISVQYHNERSEVWYIPDDNAKFELTVAEEKTICTGKKRVDIPVGYIHCIKNLGEKPLYIHEAQLGKCLENDIVRIFDPYASQR